MVVKVDNRFRDFPTTLSSGVLGRAKSGKTTLLLLGAIELAWLKPDTNIFFVSSRESPEQLIERAVAACRTFKAYREIVPANLAFHTCPKEGRILSPPTGTTIIVLD